MTSADVERLVDEYMAAVENRRDCQALDFSAADIAKAEMVESVTRQALLAKFEQMRALPKQLRSDHPLAAKRGHRLLELRRQHAESRAELKPRELDLGLIDVGLELAEHRQEILLAGDGPSGDGGGIHVGQPRAGVDKADAVPGASQTCRSFRRVSPVRRWYSAWSMITAPACRT